MLRRTRPGKPPPTGCLPKLEVRHVGWLGGGRKALRRVPARARSLTRTSWLRWGPGLLVTNESKGKTKKKVKKLDMRTGIPHTHPHTQEREREKEKERERERERESGTHTN